MAILDVLRIGSGRRTDSGAKRLAALCDVEPFRASIRREMCRSDRIRLECTLAAFDLSGVDRGRAAMMKRMAQALLARSRITDEIGYLGDSVLGALLPHTPPEGAMQFAEDVCQTLAWNSPQPAYQIYCYPSGEDGQGKRAGSRDAAALPMESLLAQPPQVWKRVLDIAGASVGLILTAPVVLAAAAATKLSSPGPAFYSQLRTGLGGRPFTIHKLRTMVADAEAKQETLRRISEQDGPAFKLRNDPRVTWIGRILRKTSIDELPQLWNVLKGDMSLVGPRPLPCREAEACRHWHRHRLEVIPGLTCIWQVRGRSKVSFEEWMRMDLRYIFQQGFLHDLAILIQTIPAVLLRRGAC